VKLVALLRDPVDRAYSDYRHKIRQGTEELSFEEALHKESERIAGERDRMLADSAYYSRALRRHSYLSRGIYVDQIRDWREYFDPEQILILKSEDLYEDPQGVSGKALAFIGLEGETLSTRSYGYGGGAEPIVPETRRWLQEYYEPHKPEAIRVSREGLRLVERLAQKHTWRFIGGPSWGSLFRA